MENKNEIVGKQVSSALSSSSQLLSSILKDCPEPTQAELRKSIAAQGALLSTAGIALMQSLRGQRKTDSKMKIALKMIELSIHAFETASKISDKNSQNLQKPQISQKTEK